MGVDPEDHQDSTDEDDDYPARIEATPSTKTVLPPVSEENEGLDAGAVPPDEGEAPPPPPPEPESESEEEEDRCCFHRSQYIGISGEDCLEFHANEPWPDDVLLFQPNEDDQILLPDTANCLAVQAYLKMCGLAYEVEPRSNAEYMSPSGKVPFIKCGSFVISELDPIIGFISTKGIGLSNNMDPTQKADMRDYMSLVNNVLANAEQYVTWVDSQTLSRVTKPRNGSVYPWPLNHFINWQKSSRVKSRLSVLGWYQKSLDEVCQEVENCCITLSDRIASSEYFAGSSPSELDCLVYGHLFAILTAPNATYTKAYNQLADVIHEHDALLSFVNKIDSSFFGRSTRLSVDESLKAPPPPPPSPSVEQLPPTPPPELEEPSPSPPPSEPEAEGPPADEMEEMD